MSGVTAAGPGRQGVAHRPLSTYSPEMVVGVIGALVAILTALLAPNAADARLGFGMLLTGIGFVYLGFAISDGRKSAILVQAISALVFIWVAQIAVREDSTLLLGLGFLAHGAWDALHHEHHGWTRVRTYWPPFCAVADVLIAIAIFTGLAV